MPPDEVIETLSGQSELDWLEAACQGFNLPAEADAELKLASAAWHDFDKAEAHLKRVMELAPGHPAAYIALYRFYFYKNRLAQAYAVGWDCLERAAQDNGLSSDWRQVRIADADFSDLAILPRFYLFTLKACAYLSMRLGDLETGAALIDKLTELDPKNQLGGKVLREVLDRVGREDDDE